MTKLLIRLLVVLEHQARRITAMDAAVTKLTADVAALTTEVAAVVANAGKLDPENEAAVVAASTAIEAAVTALAAVAPKPVTPPAV